MDLAVSAVLLRRFYRLDALHSRPEAHIYGIQTLCEVYPKKLHVPHSSPVLVGPETCLQRSKGHSDPGHSLQLPHFGATPPECDLIPHIPSPSGGKRGHGVRGSTYTHTSLWALLRASLSSIPDQSPSEPRRPSALSALCRRLADTFPHSTFLPFLFLPEGNPSL